MVVVQTDPACQSVFVVAVVVWVVQMETVVAVVWVVQKETVAAVVAAIVVAGVATVGVVAVVAVDADVGADVDVGVDAAAVVAVVVVDAVDIGVVAAVLTIGVFGFSCSFFSDFSFCPFLVVENYFRLGSFVAEEDADLLVLVAAFFLWYLSAFSYLQGHRCLHYWKRFRHFHY